VRQQQRAATDAGSRERSLGPRVTAADDDDIEVLPEFHCLRD
jgi:hypothetical protein